MTANACEMAQKIFGVLLMVGVIGSIGFMLGWLRGWGVGYEERGQREQRRQGRCRMTLLLTHRCRGCGQPVTDVLTYVDVPGERPARVLARVTLDRTGARHQCPTTPTTPRAA